MSLFPNQIIREYMVIEFISKSFHPCPLPAYVVHFHIGFKRRGMSKEWFSYSETTLHIFYGCSDSAFDKGRKALLLLYLLRFTLVGRGCQSLFCVSTVCLCRWHNPENSFPKKQKILLQNNATTTTPPPPTPETSLLKSPHSGKLLN